MEAEVVSVTRKQKYCKSKRWRIWWLRNAI